MIRNWLRAWLGIEDESARIQKLGAAEDLVGMVKDLDERVARRLAHIEEELAKQEASHAVELQELRDRLDMPAKKKASGRPFAVLQKVAELGAQAQRVKDAG